MAERLRNTRTAAGFEPMPCKKHTEKVTTLPLESIKEDIQKSQYEQHQNHWAMQKAHRKNA